MSKGPGTNSESIEEWYAARAAEHMARNARIAATEDKDEATALLSDCPDASPVGDPDDRDEKKEDAENLDSGEEPPANERGPEAYTSLTSPRIADALRNAVVPSDSLWAATMHLTIAMRAAKAKTQDALDIAIATLKKMDVVAVAKAILDWIKAHPWETAAIVIPLVLLACTPAFLGLVGFTAGGIAAGKDICLLRCCESY